MYPYITALAVAVGRSRKHSLYTVLFRLIVLGIMGLSLGLGLAISMPSLPLTSFASPFSLGLSGIFLFQLMTLLILVGTSSLVRHDRYGSLLLLWPLSPRQRTVLWLIPDSTLCLLGMLCLAPTLFRSFDILGLGNVELTGCLLLGVLSGFGLHYNLPNKVKLFSIPALVGLEYFLVRNVTMHPRGFGVPATLALVLFTLTAFSCWWIKHRVLALSMRQKTVHDVTPLPIPIRWWIVRKLFRNKRMTSSLITSVVLSSGLSLLVMRTLPAALAVPALGLLAAASTSDLRGTLRRHNPAEICALKGTPAFCSSIVTGSLLCIAALLPLIVVILQQTHEPTVLSYLVLGCSAGIIASTMVTAQDRDILGQFMTMLLSIGLFVYLPQALQLDMTTTRSCILQSVIGILLCLCTLGIEYQRNPYDWKKYV